MSNLPSSSPRLSVTLLRPHVFAGLLIAFVALLSYSNTFHASFNFDDIDNILINPLVKSGNGSLWDTMLTSRRAVGQLTFAMNYRISGTNVLGYHLTNLSIHILSSCVLYLLILVTCRNAERRHASPRFVPDQNFSGQIVALFTALLFVAHPVQTQAVTYIVQRLSSLCTLFYLAAMFFYAVARYNAEYGAINNGAQRLKVWGYITAALISAILAVKTKEIAFTFPVMVLLYEFMFFHTDFNKRIKYLLLPVAAPLAVLSIMVFQATRKFGVIGLREFTQAESNISRFDYLLTQLRVITTYIRLIFLPINQSIDYDYPFFTSFNLEVAFSALLLGLIFSGAIWLWIRSNQMSTSPGSLYLRLMAFGIIWFFVTLSIESSIIPIIDVIFEHRLYLPLSGVALTTTAAIMYVTNRPGQRFSTKPVMTMLFLTITLILAIATYKRNAIWANELTLWQDAYSKAPNKARVANNYAAALILRGRGETALPLLITSIERVPGHFTTWNNIPRVYDQMSFMKGKYRSGFDLLLPSGDVNPAYVAKWFSNAQNNLGLAYQLQNNIPKAFDSYRKSLTIDPSFALARKNAIDLISSLPDRAAAERYSGQLPKMPGQ